MPEVQPADPLAPEAPSAERLPPESEDAYRARLIAKIERGLADVQAGRVVPHAEVMAQLEARYGHRSIDAPEVGGTLDGSGGRRYDQPMPEAQRAERLQPETEDAYRERVVAKIERSLASLDAGRGVPHAEVLAMLDARYPGSK
jgi:predicted transcriptional regulator